jgi:hypothetical protein
MYYNTPMSEAFKLNSRTMRFCTEDSMSPKPAWITANKKLKEICINLAHKQSFDVDECADNILANYVK